MKKLLCLIFLLFLCFPLFSNTKIADDSPDILGSMTHFLFQVAIIIFAARGGNFLFSKLKLPSVLGELVAGIMPLESLRWDLNLTLSRNRIRNYTDFVDDWDNWGSQISLSMDETDISFSPSIVGGSKISYELLDGVNLSLLSKLVGKQYIDNSGSDEHILDPYFINDVQILYSVNTNIFEELSFHILLNNILNNEYESNAWIYKYYLGGMEYKMDGYFPQAGFHFLAGVTVRI